jgi:FtsP/CotA-like multicopper oxidase with cupredoxin domain
MPHNSEPQSPLLHTKGLCGANNTNVINVPENATVVELIINNLSPTAHVVHLHGQKFKV